MSEVAEFLRSVEGNIERLKKDDALHELSRRWLEAVTPHKYSHNFTWMGRPIIQVPQDVMAMQEIVWKIRPDLIVETGVAHGGSLIFYASMLELIGEGEVVGIDIEIRPHNREEIEKHSMAKRIVLVQGSSVEKTTVDAVHALARNKKRVLVVLDSNHTHAHTLAELNAYSGLVKKGGYLVVFDTAIEDLPDELFGDRPWKKGDNPKTAVWEFLRRSDRFRIDKDIEAKLQITVAPDGYLLCVKD